MNPETIEFLLKVPEVHRSLTMVKMLFLVVYTSGGCGACGVVGGGSDLFLVVPLAVMVDVVDW